MFKLDQIETTLTIASQNMIEMFQPVMDVANHHLSVMDHKTIDSLWEDYFTFIGINAVIIIFFWWAYPLNVIALATNNIILVINIIEAYDDATVHPVPAA